MTATTELTLTMSRRHDLDEDTWQQNARRFIDSWLDLHDMGTVENVEMMEDTVKAFQYPTLYTNSTPYVIRITTSGGWDRTKESTFHIDGDATITDEPEEHSYSRKPFIAGGILVTIGTAVRMIAQSVSWWDIAALGVVMLVLLVLYREA